MPNRPTTYILNHDLALRYFKETSKSCELAMSMLQSLRIAQGHSSRNRRLRGRPRDQQALSRRRVEDAWRRRQCAFMLHGHTVGRLLDCFVFCVRSRQVVRGLLIIGCKSHSGQTTGRFVDGELALAFCIRPALNVTQVSEMLRFAHGAYFEQGIFGCKELLAF